MESLEAGFVKPSEICWCEFTHIHFPNKAFMRSRTIATSIAVLFSLNFMLGDKDLAASNKDFASVTSGDGPSFCNASGLSIGKVGSIMTETKILHHSSSSTAMAAA